MNRLAACRVACIALAGLVCLAAAEPPARAATIYTWQPTTGGSWGTAGNWNPAAAPGAADDTADFSTKDIAAAATVNLDGSRTIGFLKFGDAGVTPNADWIVAAGSGGGLTLSVTAGTPGITVNNRTATLNVAVDSAASLTKLGGGTLVLNNSSALGGIQVSAGTMVLNAANTLGGNVVIANGANHLRIANGAALAGATTVRVDGNGASLQLAGVTAGAGQTLSIAGNGINNQGALHGYSGASTWEGALTVSAALSRVGAANGATLNITGVIGSGSNLYGVVVRNGGDTGTVVLSAANTYLGPTEIYNGVLRLGADDTLSTVANLNMLGTVGAAVVELDGFDQTVAGLGGANDAMSKTIRNTGASTSVLTLRTPYGTSSSFYGAFSGDLRVVKTGSATQVLFGPTSTHTGGTIVHGGQLTLAQSSGTPLTGDIVLGAGILAAAPTAAGPAALSLATAGGALLVADGGGTLQLTRKDTSTLAVTFGNSGAAAGSVVVRGAGRGTIAVDPSSGTSAAGLGNVEKVLVNGGVTNLNGGTMVAPWVFGQDSDAANTADFLRYDAAAGLVRATYSASTDLNGGTAFADPRVFEAQATTTNTLAANAAVYALKNSGQTIDTAGFTLSVGENAGQAGVILNGGQIGTPAAPGTLDFGAAEALLITSSAAGGSTIHSALQAGGGLTKAGFGLLTLAGDTSGVSGRVTVNGGALRWSGATLPAGNLTVAGGSFEIGAVNGSLSRALGTADGQVQIGGGTSGFSYGGASGKGTVTIGSDLSTIVWDSEGFRPAAFMLNASTATNPLDFRNGIDLAGANRTISVGANTATVAGAIVNSSTRFAAGLIKTGGGTLELPVANSFNGPVRVAGGTLAVRVIADGGVASGLGTSSAAAANLVLESGTALRYTGAAASSNRGFTIGTVGVRLEASGTGPLSLTNTAPIAMVSGAVRTLTLAGNNGGNNTLAAAIVNDGANATSLTKEGTGTWIITGANTYGGATKIDGGGLRILSDAALGNTASITVNNKDAARLEIGGGITVNRPITLAGKGTNNGALSSVGGNNTWAGPITLAAPETRIGSLADTLTISGVIGGNYDLNVRNGDAGDPLVVLTNQNNYSGATGIVVGRLRIDGGDDRLPTTSLLVMGNTSNVGAAVFELNGRNQQVAGIADGPADRTMPLTVTNAAATPSTLTVDVGAALSRRYTGVVSGNLAFAKSGDGTQILGGLNTYTGATLVQDGTLALAHATSSNNIASSTAVRVDAGATLDGSGLAGGGLTLASGQTLSGNGAVEGRLTVAAGGTLAPGNSPGAITLDDGLTFSGGTFAIDVNGTAAGSGYDQVVVNGGTVALGSGLAELAISTSGYSPAVGDTLWIINNLGGATTGYFVGLPENSLVDIAGVDFAVHYNADFDTNATFGGNDILLAAVPEPGPLAMLAGAAAMGLAALWRRRKAARAAA